MSVFFLKKERGSWLAFLVFFVWRMLIAFALWQKSQAAVQPPAYDAATYFLKARNIWTGLHNRPVSNPFNVDPTVRPPGTVLVTAPLGFDPDFRGFYFRSAFFPVLAFAVTIYIAAWSHALSSWSHWSLVITAMFLTALPMFYHFELVQGLFSPVHWGLVDNFFSVVAALGAAFIL